jgi:carbamate kinase
LRSVAADPQPLAALDREAVDSLLRDGLVVVEADMVGLPA